MSWMPPSAVSASADVQLFNEGIYPSTGITVSIFDFTFAYAARADITYTTAGVIQDWKNGNATSRGGVGTNHGDWLDDVSGLPGSSGDYEIFCTVISNPDGALAGDPTGQWIDITAEMDWYVTYSANVTGSNTATIDIEIREKANTSNSAKHRVVLTAGGQV